MFQEDINILKNDIKTIISILRTNEEIRKVKSNESLNNVEYLKHLPNFRDWLIYDHCSCITRIYAIYEKFVESLIKNWILILPLSVGDNIFLVSETKAHCQLVTIVSIKLEDVSKQQINISSEQEIGLKFAQDARKDLKLYQEIDIY